jgi:hypothetical protein
MPSRRRHLSFFAVGAADDGICIRWPPVSAQPGQKPTQNRKLRRFWQKAALFR